MGLSKFESPEREATFFGWIRPAAEPRVLNSCRRHKRRWGIHQFLGGFFRFLDSNVLDCFDFITDDRTATNAPSVLVISDDEIEIVSRRVITQPVFLKPERDQSEVKFLVEKYPQTLQNG